ncbi:MAG: peptidoglycan DD-metalloendopeptidase family protein [Flavobacteriales bacterium]|mgnify:FL=1|jgi:septal ring factor EnvC (AmiA/AmiB activator)|nr:peptidoglycan DD-metalloendopeptidase family protein [Flavobacteriales bacterium]
MNKSISLLFLILFTVSFSAFSQKKSDQLKKKERELQQKILNTKNLIKLTRNSEQLSLTELGIIQHQIAYREELVSHYNYQIRKLDTEVSDTKKQILSIENTINNLREEYKKMIIHAFKNRNTDFKYLYIISAKTFSEAFHRMKYIQHYKDYRQEQINQIAVNQNKLEEKIQFLQGKINAKQQISLVQKTEKEAYLEDKIKQQETYSKLKANENKYKSLLNAQQKKKRKIALAIRKAIEIEIAATIKKSDNKFTLTPEGSALSKTFTSNKGKLPWPVTKGEITGKYGKHRHDIVSTATVDNNGIDITTEKKAKIRAVFQGKVTSVLIIPGAGKVVMISHGDYRTVYSNLKEVYVKKGAQIKTKQLLGQLLENEDGNVSEAHFEIWKITSAGLTTENPSLWISK